MGHSSDRNRLRANSAPGGGRDRDRDPLAAQEAFYRSQQDAVRKEALMYSQGMTSRPTEAIRRVANTLTDAQDWVAWHSPGMDHVAGPRAARAVIPGNTVRDPSGTGGRGNQAHAALPSRLSDRIAGYQDEDAVVIVCGRCKTTFTDARLFVQHKAQELDCLASDECSPAATGKQRQPQGVAETVNELYSRREKAEDAALDEKLHALDVSPGKNAMFTPVESTPAYTKVSTDFLGADADGSGGEAEPSLDDGSISGMIPGLGAQGNNNNNDVDDNHHDSDTCYTRIPLDSDIRLASNVCSDLAAVENLMYSPPMFPAGKDPDVIRPVKEASCMGPPVRTVSGSTVANTVDSRREVHPFAPSPPLPPHHQQLFSSEQQQRPRAEVILPHDPQMQDAPELQPGQQPRGPWLSRAQQKSLQQAMSFANDTAQQLRGAQQPTRHKSPTVSSAATSPEDWFTEQERDHIPSLLGLGEYIGPGSSWKTPVALSPGTGIVLSGKFLPVGSSRYDKHFSFGLDLWDMTLPFSTSEVRQRALYINPIFASREIQIGSLIDDEFVGVRHVAEGNKFPFRPGGKFTFAILCRDHGFKIWWKGTRGEGGTIYAYQYDVGRVKYLRVYDCHAIYIALGFRF